MKNKREKNLRRVKPKRRIRGAPALFQPNLEESKTSNMVKDPETPMDVARLLRDEIKKRWPDASGIPDTISGKHTKLIKNMLEEFPGETIREMIRVVVWDFDEIQRNKGFFPPSSHLNWPWLDQLYHYRLALSGAVGKGITDSTSRVSAYVQRYHSGSTPGETSVPTEGESMRDIAKRLLGQ